MSEANGNDANWFQNQFPDRLEKIREAARNRNRDKQISMASSNRYNELKKAIYNMSESAFIEGSISEEEKNAFTAQVKKVDTDSLKELRSLEDQEHMNRNNNKNGFQNKRRR